MRTTCALRADQRGRRGETSLSFNLAEQLRTNFFPVDQFDGAIIDFLDPSFDLAIPGSFNCGSRTRIKALDEQAGESCAIVLRKLRGFSEEFLQVSAIRE